MTLPDVDDLSALGGVKINYAPVEDPTTDLDADQDNKTRTNVAMSTHTVTRGWVNLTLGATTGAMTLDDHDALWGDLVAVAPTLARSSTGVYTVTFPASVNDELGVSHSVALRAAWVAVRSATRQRIQCAVTAANVVTVYTFNSSDAAADSTSPISLFVF